MLERRFEREGTDMATIIERSEEGLFGFGRGGLPGEIDEALRREGAIEELAIEIIDRWLEWAEDHRIRGGRRVADNQLPELATLASVLIRYHAKHQVAPTSIVAFALEHVLGLINPETDSPLPAAKVLERYGLPAVDKTEAFLRAARLDGEADATRSQLSERRLAKLVKVSRDTIKRWRTIPAYQRRRTAVGRLVPVTDKAYRTFRTGGRQVSKPSAN